MHCIEVFEFDFVQNFLSAAATERERAELVQGRHPKVSLVVPGGRGKGSQPTVLFLGSQFPVVFLRHELPILFLYTSLPVVLLLGEHPVLLLSEEPPVVGVISSRALSPANTTILYEKH